MLGLLGFSSLDSCLLGEVVLVYLFGWLFGRAVCFGVCIVGCLVVCVGDFVF